MFDFILLGMLLLSITAFLLSIPAFSDLTYSNKKVSKWRVSVRKPLEIIEKNVYVEMERTIRYPSERK